MSLRATLLSSSGESRAELEGAEEQRKCLLKKPCFRHRPSHGSSSQGPRNRHGWSSCNHSFAYICLDSLMFIHDG